MISKEILSRSIVIHETRGDRYLVGWLEQDPANPRNPFNRHVVSKLFVPGVPHQAVINDFLSNVQRNLNRHGIFKRWLKLKAPTTRPGLKQKHL